MFLLILRLVGVKAFLNKTSGFLGTHTSDGTYEEGTAILTIAYLRIIIDVAASPRWILNGWGFKQHSAHHLIPNELTVPRSSYIASIALSMAR